MKPTRRKLLLLLLLGLACFRYGIGDSIARADASTQRIVSLSPATTEWVFEFGLGSRLVGRTEACDYPPEALQIPSVGGFLSPNIGLIMKLKPTLVIVTTDFNARRVAELERAGLSLFRYDVASATSMLRSAQELALRLGVAGKGRDFVAASAFENGPPRLTGVSGLTVTRGASRASYLGFVDVKERYLVSEGSFLGSVFAHFGLNNLLEIKQGYPQVAQDFLRQQRPAVVFLFDNPMDRLGTPEGPLQLPERETAAIKSYWPEEYNRMRIVRLPGDLFLRPGPRLLTQGYAHLAARLDALGVR
jgi:iron complex transport system substrate-binding protein